MSGEAIAYEAVDVARMVSELNITERSVARAFCVRGAEDFSLFAKLAAAETFEEVWGLYLAAPSGSEMMEAMLAKMEELFSVRFAAAHTFDEVRELYLSAVPSGSEMRKAALRKLATFFPKKN